MKELKKQKRNLLLNRKQAERIIDETNMIRARNRVLTRENRELKNRLEEADEKLKKLSDDIDNN